MWVLIGKIPMGRPVFLPIKGQLRKEMRRAERERGGGGRMGRKVGRGQEGRKKEEISFTGPQIESHKIS